MKCQILYSTINFDISKTRRMSRHSFTRVQIMKFNAAYSGHVNLTYYNNAVKLQKNFYYSTLNKLMH